MNKIYLCGGNKGGTGKSMLATALIDAFLQRGIEPLLVETDDANPDVFKAHGERIQCAALSLDEAQGRIYCHQPEQRTGSASNDQHGARSAIRADHR